MTDAKGSSLLLLLSMANRIVPFGLLFGYALLIAAPATRDFARAMSLENRPIELLTFGLLLMSAYLSLRLARRARAHGESWLVFGFYPAFGIALLVIAMEEIAWGQAFFGWSTPERWRELNLQRETTLHNLDGLQGRGGYFRIAFVLGGLIGILIGRLAAFRDIAAPTLLLPWLLAVGIEAGVHFYPFVIEPDQRIDRGLRVLSEMSELLIAIAALLYVESNRRRLERQWRDALLGPASMPTAPSGRPPGSG